MRCPVCDYKLSNKGRRNLANHKRFFVFVKFIYEHQDVYSGIDSLRKELVKQTGRCDTHHHVDGSISFEPHSLSFCKMSEDEFRLLFSDCIDVALKYFCKNMTEDELWHVAGF